MMAFCTNCGSKLPDGATSCPNCGAPQPDAPQAAPENVSQTPPQAPQTPRPDPGPKSEPNNNGQPTAQAPVDNGGFGWGLLGFCIPLVGLILFLVWKDSKPKTSKAAGVGALVSVIITAVLYVISLIAGVGLSLLGG